MKQQHKKTLVQLITEFAKLQLASNIPFWGTLIGSSILLNVVKMDPFFALLIPTVLANLLFFFVDQKWVFANSKGRRKSSSELAKFIIFMTLSAAAVFYLTMMFHLQLNVPFEASQFLAGFCASFWTFFCLRFWVFAPAHHGPFSSSRSSVKVKPRHRTTKPKTA